MVRTADGREILLSASGAPVRDANDTIIGAVAIFRDVTERRRLEAEAMIRATKLEAIFHALADGVLVFDRDGYMVECNSAARELFGTALHASERTEQADDNAAFNAGFGGAGGRARLDALPVAQVLRGEVLKGLAAADLQVSMPDGSQKDLQISGAPMQDGFGRVTGAVCVARDVTERRRLERETNRRMNEFLGVAGHELRTPLTSISAGIQLAERRLRHARAEAPSGDLSDTGPIAMASEVLSRIFQQTRRLDRLIGDLLDVSRIQANRLELRLAPLDLVASVRDVVNDLRQLEPARSLILHISDSTPARVMADGDRISQVVVNYLTNALKYSAPDTAVHVRVETTPSEVRVLVIDRGPGLAADELSHIWDLFYRAPSVEVLSGSGVGLGLGLHISATIVDRHGGRVGVDSALGHGSTFWFSLPLIL
jgi:signal transduction histidine kinase